MKENELKSVDCINLAWYEDQLWALVNTVIKFYVAWNEKNKWKFYTVIAFWILRVIYDIDWSTVSVFSIEESYPGYT